SRVGLVVFLLSAALGIYGLGKSFASHTTEATPSVYRVSSRAAGNVPRYSSDLVAPGSIVTPVVSRASTTPGDSADCCATEKAAASTEQFDAHSYIREVEELYHKGMKTRE